MLDHFMLNNMQPEERVAYLKEMSEGYRQTSMKAEARLSELDERKDKYEVKQLRQVIEYCSEMAERVLEGKLDERERMGSWCSFDEHIDVKVPEHEEREKLIGDDKYEAELRHLTANVGAGVLNPSERRTVDLTIGANIKVDEAAAICGNSKLTTQTLLRDARAKWRRIANVGNALG